MHNLLPRRFLSLRVLIIALLVLFSSLLTGKSAHAEDYDLPISVTVGGCISDGIATAMWLPYVAGAEGANVTIAELGTANFEVNFAWIDGTDNCAESVPPTGTVSGEISGFGLWGQSNGCPVGDPCDASTTNSFTISLDAPPDATGTFVSGNIALVWTP
jgi:hypothetical protein